MPNWCLTSYVISGPKEDIRSLYGKMKRLQDRKESLLPNGFGKTWLGNLVHRLGKNYHTVDCRGDWSELKMKDGEIHFNTETAWSRCDEVEELIQTVYPDLSIWFISEELGCGIFETNDATGDIFPERIIIDNEDEMEYYTPEEAHKKICDILEVSPDTLTWKEAVKKVSERYELPDKVDNDYYISITEVEVV